MSGKGTDSSGRLLRYGTVIASLAVMFLVLIGLNIVIGSVRVPLGELLHILFTGGGGDTWQGIIWKIRLPRLFESALLGGALALSGFLLQTFFNNPIAGPYVLGISSGAKLTVAAAMITAFGAQRSPGSWFLVSAAFLGALMSMGVVLLVARRVRRSATLIVCGVMIGYICSAITDFLITFADDASIVNLHNWTRGSFSGATWDDIRVISVVVLSASAVVFLLSKPISAYQMGEYYAKNMGVNVQVFRIVLVLLSSVLSACVTAFAGPVSFVGIAVPHLVKALLNTSKPIVVIPVCFLGGSVFCMACDLIARTAFAPQDISVSSVTAVFGAPVVIALMIKKRGREM